MSTYKPDYQRIADDLREQIASQKLKPGDKLPSKRELREAYGTSAQPVDAALFLLRAEGLIEGRQGKGTFVLGAREQHE
ncbi:winged helix-turn-helix domain-containing protein [Micromonospora rubida]|uniref:Winged helix-turn-helix domain-containing protein n=1 Tax=Micromonospora rubida TaxID=2697657 RepID=A0ABW7SDC1_9ACTN